MKPTVFFHCILLCGFFIGCKIERPVLKESAENEIIIPYTPAFTQHYPEYDPQLLTEFLHQFSSKNISASDFYKKNNYQPVWVGDTLDTNKLSFLLSCLYRAPEHGLKAEWFRPDDIHTLIDSIQAGAYTDKPSLLYSSLAQLEYLSVQALIDYSTIMTYGITSPRELYPKEYHISVQRQDSLFYSRLFNDIVRDTDSLINALQPENNTYKSIQQTLKAYESKSDMEFKPIPTKEKETKKYKVNDKGEIFPLIAERLMLTGELPYSEHPDSLYTHLTPELLEAINQFRKNNSYREETEIDNHTFKALNRPFSYYRKKMIANLERYRWKRKSGAPSKYIEVNVAGFLLKGIDRGKDTVVMKVCVGKPQNATPLLESKITYANLNPSWNVPGSITKKEIYFSIKKDSTYLKRKGMKLIKDGKEVDPATIDLNKVQSKDFNYRIVQSPGRGNSLGRIKFMFENPFAVYLHDTPEQRAFSYSNRAVSHGCVRLEKPLDLASFCITGGDSLYLDRIRYSIDRPPLSTEGKALMKKNKLNKVQDIVHLKESVSLFIDYYTAYTLPGKSELYIADDIYNMDEKIIQELEIRGESMLKLSLKEI